MKTITNLRGSIFVFFIIHFFLFGVDTYIILPTAWYYIHSLGFSKTFYGVVIGGQPLGFLLFSPLIGKLADKTRRPKIILLICLLLKVTANIVYAIPVSGFCPLVGLFVSGAANGGYGVMYGEMVRHTMGETRSKLFILVDCMWSLGAATGPIFGSVVTFKLNILGWPINDVNSPGIILALSWSILLCVLIFLPSDFGREVVCLIDKEEHIQQEKRKSSIASFGNTSTVLCLFYLNFTNFLMSMSVSGLTPLLAMDLFHLKLVHVKILFAAGIMMFFVSLLAFYIATAYHSERCLLAFAVILPVPSILLLCSYAFMWKNVSFSTSSSLFVFVSFGMPQSVFAFAASLLSKITPSEHASSLQTGLVVTAYLAAMIARGLSGLVFVQTWLIVYSLFLVSFLLAAIAWLAFVFHRLAPQNL